MGRRTRETCAKNPSGVPFNIVAVIVLLGSALRRQVYPVWDAATHRGRPEERCGAGR